MMKTNKGIINSGISYGSGPYATGNQNSKGEIEPWKDPVQAWNELNQRNLRLLAESGGKVARIQGNKGTEYFFLGENDDGK